ncbi:hypothetical protein CE91St46_33840 [Eubacteriales bacterium]|nr:hypothetical protein CE91St46_33840 [Eubacteriales bacterium]GKH64993.1 hypothetical protein CE91St47_34620 [Eubacteriales bacterium]
MKREELSSLGLGEELIGRVMALHGADIERHKNEASMLRSRLAEAEERLGALEGAQGEAESWRERFEILEAETARREYRRAAESAAGALRFSSKGARQAFLAALDERQLPLEGEEFSKAEYQMFLEGYRDGDPGAFEELCPAPRFVASTPGTGFPVSNRHAQANDALRVLLQKN